MVIIVNPASKMADMMIVVPGLRSTITDDRARDLALRLARRGQSIELIAREIGRSRYFVETTLDRAPAGRNDVPYRYRAIKVEADVAGRYRAGESAEDIARVIGVSVTTVFEWLRADGVDLRGKSGPHTRSFEDVLTREFLVAEYTDAGRSASEIADQVGCSEPTVRNWLRRHRIPTRPMSARRRAYEISVSLLDDVAEGSTTLDAAAITVGCSRSEILRALRRAGRNLPRDRRPALTKKRLRQMYVQQGMTCPQIAAETGWAPLTIRTRLKAYGIDRRLGPPRRPTA